MYTNPFPVGYNPAQMIYSQQYQQAVQQPSPQMMTPPTIHAEIVQVESLEAAINYPAAVGVPVMMQLKDDSAFVIKTAFANAQPMIEVYKKQPPIQQQTAGDFITREEFEKRLAAMTTPQEGSHEPV